MFKNTSSSFGLLTRIFHWTISILFISLLYVGYIMINMKDSPEKWELYGTHKAVGVVSFLIVIMRLFWKYINISVKPLETLTELEKKISGYTHVFLYFLMFIMPLSGLGMSLFAGYDISVFGLFKIPAFKANKELSGFLANVHLYAAYMLAFTIPAHIFAALYHHFIKKDNVLMRMIKG